MLIPASACQDGTPSSIVDGSEYLQADSHIVTAEEESARLELPKKDFGGADFMIAYIDWTLYNGNILSDNETGDTINDAVYRRRILTEDNAGVKLSMIDLGTVNDIQPKVSISVKAGDDAYQLILVHCISGIAGLASQGLVENWNDIPFADLTMPWWKQSANENLSVQGIQTHAVSEFIRSDPVALIFNLEMTDNYSLDDPYTLVFDGSWTWDQLSEMALAVSEDINGDGVMDINDQYGYLAAMGWQFVGIPHSCNQLMMEKDADGVPVIVFNNEKMYSIVEMIYNLLYDGKNRSFTWQNTRENDPNLGGKPPVDFGAGHALFYQIPLTSIPNYRATEIDFGVLPFPKYDTQQENYLSLDWSGLMCVPKGADTELSGYITELLSYYSMETTVPAWYDILLTDKITRDDNSIKVLDIIYSNLVYDYGLNYSESHTDMLYAMYNVLSEKSANFASFYSANQAAANTHYNNIYDSVIKNYSK